jgi:hypothetical protein
LERALLCFDGYELYQRRKLNDNLPRPAASIIDKAIELHTIGGVYGNQRPTEFLCLLLKLLQIQPEKEILIEYLQAEEFKYAPLYFLYPITDMIQQIPSGACRNVCSNDVSSRGRLRTPGTFAQRLSQVTNTAYGYVQCPSQLKVLKKN